ncbi:hypothetical protein K402DRAFT_349933 [Aulographum hederae CBS 113979]|uniref:Mitochondrial export protein Som1 n=1 Tax=Aulographum hederae CBS 113979 TaxID=1176131 RepID=A0A6G1H9V9_9PEZI|nr:hypothetical protein K402DRAFT_349933 [Aulographum hederae CBS 113979]
MAPPVQIFPPTELSERVQSHASGKRRKPPVNLEECKLMEMVQYMCDVENPRELRATIVCKPVTRLFRRCANGLTVETTSWEGLTDGEKKGDAVR